MSVNKNLGKYQIMLDSYINSILKEINYMTLLFYFIHNVKFFIYNLILVPKVKKK